MKQEIVKILKYNNCNPENCSKHFPELFDNTKKMSVELKVLYNAWEHQRVLLENYKSGELINLAHGNPTKSKLSLHFKRVFNSIVKRQNLCAYPSSAGNEESKKILANYINKRYFPSYLVGIDNIIIGNSTTYLFNLICQNLLRPHDVMIIPTPTYGIFAYIPERYNATIKLLELSPDDNWFINPKKLEALISNTNNRLKKYSIKNNLQYIPRVSMLLLINPSNPIGNFYSKSNKKEINEIANICVNNNVVVVEDLLYDGTLYSDKLVSIMNTIAFPENAIILNGLSKAYGLASFRAGFAVSNKIVINCMRNKLFQNMDSSSLIQSKALEGIFGTKLSKLRQIENKNTEIYYYNIQLLKAIIYGFSEIKQRSLKNRIIKDVNKITKNRKYTQLFLKGISRIKMLENSFPKSGFFVNIDFSQLKGAVIENKKIENIYDVLFICAKYCGFKFLCGTTYGFSERTMIGRFTFSENKYKLIQAMYKFDKIINKEKYYETN